MHQQNSSPKPLLHAEPSMHGIGCAARGTSIGDHFSLSEKASNIFTSTHTDSNLHNINVRAASVLEEAKTYSREEVIAFGGISEESIRGTRSSARIGAQPNVDGTQMQRAMGSAQRKSVYNMPGTSTPNKVSLLSFTCSNIIDKAKSMGVSLGNSTEVENVSAKVILDNECRRSLTLLKPNENSDEVGICLLVNRASSLCEDLNDEENLLDDEFSIEQPTVVNGAKIKKKKKAVDKAPLRRSTRTKFKKSYS
jgi:hypothetical protein